MAEQKNDAPTVRVVYFCFTGRAEPLRYAAVLGGVCLEDQFMTGDVLKKEKAEGKRRWSGVPELILLDKDGKETATIGQSTSLLRYIGKIGGNGLYPEDALEAARVDEILDSVEDMSSAMQAAMKGKESDEEKKAAVAEAIKEGGALRYWLDKFVNRVTERKEAGVKSGLFVNENITIAELKFTSVLKMIFMRAPGAKEAFSGDKYKPLMAISDAVEGNEKIKAFNEQFGKNMAAYKEKPEVNIFKYDVK